MEKTVTVTIPDSPEFCHDGGKSACQFLEDRARCQLYLVELEYIETKKNWYTYDIDYKKCEQCKGNT